MIRSRACFLAVMCALIAPGCGDDSTDSVGDQQDALTPTDTHDAGGGTAADPGPVPEDTGQEDAEQDSAASDATEDVGSDPDTPVGDVGPPADVPVDDVMVPDAGVDTNTQDDADLPPMGHRSAGYGSARRRGHAV